MMTPRSPSCSGVSACMAAAASRIALNVPIRLMAMTRANSASGIGPPRAPQRLARPPAGAIDQDAGNAMIGGGLRQRLLGRSTIGDVAGDGDAVDVDRHFGGGLLVDVEQRDFGAGLRQHAGGRGAQARGAAGDDSCVSCNVHGQTPACSAFAAAPAMITLGGGVSA